MSPPDGRGQGRGGHRGRPGRPTGRPSAGPARQRVRRPGPAQPVEPAVDVHDPDGVRLQKVLAHAGVGSRRACEALIAAGRVTVDGHVVTELGVRVDPTTAVITVDGVRLQLDESRTYLVLNKPRGVLSTMEDPQGRPCLADLLGDRGDRLFHVGRLDADTEGLLLLTNDGELAHRLQHPSYGVRKTYLAEVEGRVSKDVGRRLRAGVDLEDGPVAVDSFRVVDAAGGRTLVEVVLHEGRKHVVRRLLAEVGHPVTRLVRTEVGPVRLGDLRPGSTRPLTRAELSALLLDTGL
ncbi:rRNA pseudouridine synthase [Kineosporiaceae bacterium SCSIO 59966]|nr:rRNA pseudouridine synthase [Kineosporiaceae bacterium SCSIO 59966]